MSIQLQDGEQRLTVEQAWQSIGRWVRVGGAGGGLAILIECTGTGLQVRFAGNVGRRGQRHHYMTVSLAGVALLPDDYRAIPDWLQIAVDAARDKRRYNADLHGAVQRVLNPQALELSADEVQGRTRVAYFQARAQGQEAAWLASIFEQHAALEAEWQEEAQLDAELKAMLLPGER